jgi:hypothetical protein
MGKLSAKARSKYKYQHRNAHRRARMERGPHLHDDGHTLVIPSDYHNENARLFWRQHGFAWCPADQPTWQRDTRQAQGSKVYTAQAWLSATRTKFFEFYPSLMITCPCGQQFPPNDGQTLCEECQDHHTGNWR